MKIAVDMVREGIITEREALLRIDAEKVNDSIYFLIDLTVQLLQMVFFLHRMIDPASAASTTSIGSGLAASAGADKLFIG